jgi:hypothetical protein
MISYWYSPLGAIAMDGVGEPGKLRVHHRTHANSCALEVRATELVSENDFEWVHIPLVVPNVIITGINLCYQVDSVAPGRTWTWAVFRFPSFLSPAAANANRLADGCLSAKCPAHRGAAGADAAAKLPAAPDGLSPAGERGIQRTSSRRMHCLAAFGMTRGDG